MFSPDGGGNAAGRGLIGCALLASEAAAHVARLCRSNPRLLSMLVQEKCGDDANSSRFAHDFKTLADVLVQRIVAKRIGRQFPELDGNVYGEENDTIQNNKGQDVTIIVGETVEETLQCLSKALSDDLDSAKSLAEAAHKEFRLNDLNVDCYPPEEENLDLEKVGIWIDPIDSTNEYINGNVDNINEYGFHSSGLHCVTINIGLFDKHSGKPIAGVINQPFFKFDTIEGWSGRCYWAYCDGQKNLNSLPKFISCNQELVVTSNSETDEAKKALQRSGYIVTTASGAGYKMLCVALGVVKCYALTKDSTYSWDTCAAHAMLTSQGGAACPCRTSAGPLTYRSKTTGGGRAHCNADGIIASRDLRTIDRVHAILSPLHTYCNS
ncbi:inositol polyphosphate 1-phosphatase [Melanaphis sacchari]|uniref:inositol polyphosphate 1-phosphatase n=1 Tax=Melanaphis sacchari TaxID=742174 RepID=UPI000DC13A66|nr:inositol polyphosphate 1-phosphatase [Melanaphis sacchari]